MKDDLVARRQKYIQRQIQLETQAVNVRFAGRLPEEAARTIGTACRGSPSVNMP